MNTKILLEGKEEQVMNYIYRNEIAEKFGESKVGGHIDVDVSNEKTIK